jgi:hypothetical protein
VHGNVDTRVGPDNPPYALMVRSPFWRKMNDLSFNATRSLWKRIIDLSRFTIHVYVCVCVCVLTMWYDRTKISIDKPFI